MHAPAANQTVNIDLCVVLLTHASAAPFNSVSVSQAAAGASPEVVLTPDVAPTWAGQVFADASQPYAAQMTHYQAHRAAKGQRKHRRRQKQGARQALNQRRDELRVARRQQRQTRQQEDAAWQPSARRPAPHPVCPAAANPCRASHRSDGLAATNGHLGRRPTNASRPGGAAQDPGRRLARGSPGTPEPTGGLGRPTAGDGVAGDPGRH